MDKQTGIILIVVAVVIIGFIMYTSSQQAAKDRELQLQLASMNSGTSSGGLSGILSSLGDLNGLIGTIGGLFGGGSTTTTTPGTSYNLDSGIDPSARISTPYTGAEVLMARVNMDELSSVESMI